MGCPFDMGLFEMIHLKRLHYPIIASLMTFVKCNDVENTER